MISSGISLTITLIVAFFLFLVFLFTYLKLTSEFFQRARFKRVLLALLALFLFSLLIVYLFIPPKLIKARIVIFPFNEQDAATELSIEGLALADYIATNIKVNFTPDTLVYPVEWLLEAIDKDSLSCSNYLSSFAKKINADVMIYGTLERAVNNEQVLNCNIYNFKNKERQQNSTTVLSKSLKYNDEMLVNILNSFGKTTNLKKSNIEILPKNQILYAKAIDTFYKKDYKSTIDVAEKIIKQDSSNVRWRNLLARAQMEYGIQLDNDGKPGGINQIAALKICEQTLIKYDSLNAAAHGIIGKFYILEKMWGKAEEHLVKSLSYNPFNAQVFVDFASLHPSRIKKLGYRNEEELLRKAIFINPCSEKARIILTDYLFFNKYPSMADDEIANLLEINPRSIEGLLYLGKMSVAAQDSQRTLDTFNRLLSIDPNNTIAYYNLGVFYFNNGNLEEAKENFLNAVQKGNDIDSHLYLGYIYESRGDKDKAIEEYRIRIRHKKGFDDEYAKEAMDRLYKLTH